MMPRPAKWDVFISHASEDKDAIVIPLATLLQQSGVRVWLDKQQLKLGDRLREKIDHGLSNSRYGIVVLSEAFFAKEWPRKELDGLIALESAHEKRVLPVWHGVNADRVAAFSPILASRLGVNSGKGLEAVASSVLDVLREDDMAGGAPEPSTGGPVAAPPQTPPSVLIAALLGLDPVLASDASVALAQSGDAESVLDGLKPVLHRDRLAADAFIWMSRLLGALGEPAARLLVSQIERGSWEEKVAAARCFGALGAQESAGILYALLKNQDYDVQRMAVCAIGWAGRWEAISDVERLVLDKDKYEFDKLAPHVVEAVSRVCSRMPSTPSIAHHLGMLERIVAEGDAHIDTDQSNPLLDSIAWALQDGAPTIADSLSQQWALHKDVRFRRVAAQALGHLVLRRTLPVFRRVLMEPEIDTQVASDLAEGLMQLQTSESATLLWEVWKNADRAGDTRIAERVLQFAGGVADLLTDPAKRQEILDRCFADENSNAASLATLALGRLRSDPQRIRARLDGSTFFVRATAALALAEADPSCAASELPHRIDEAETVVEASLYAAGAVLAGRREMWPRLHQRLCAHESADRAYWRLLRPLRRRIVDAFESAGAPAAKHAQVWSTVMRCPPSDKTLTA